MKLELQWQRDLHFALNPNSIFIDDESIYVTERVKKLSKIDLVSGDTVWSRKVDDAYGWIAVLNDKLFYISSRDGLCIFACDTGELVREKRFRFPYLGYVRVCENTILTGGWRGYTDLQAYDLKSGELLWSQNTKTSELKKVSLPSFIDNKRILTANHTTKLIEFIDAKSGKLLNQNTLPDGIQNIDLGCSYRIVDNEITFLTNQGKLFKYNTEDLSLAIEELSLSSPQTNIPCYFPDEMVLRDTEHTYCLWNRVDKKVVWQVPIEHNSWVDVITAKLDDDHFILAGGQGAIKVVSNVGETSRLNTEKRITTPFYFRNGYLVYGTKSSIKCFKYMGR